jgi:hypothetical protein
MIPESSRIRSFTFWQRFIRISILLWGIWMGRHELSLTIMGIWNLISRKGLTNETLGAMGRVGSIAGLILLIYLLFIFWFVHFVLPVTSLSQALQAFQRMMTFGLSFGHWHGPAVFVLDGEISGSEEETRKNYPGVAFIDLRSAITLDNLMDKEDETFDEFRSPRRVHFSLFGESEYAAKIRIVGPGLTFTKKNERITGAVDLRTQSRSRNNVSADTRDGIRVNTTVSSTFTIGQPPDVLDVCLGENSEVFVIEWEKETAEHTRKVKKLTRELDLGDEKEIIEFVKMHPDPFAVKSDIPIEAHPYTFDAKRVEQAIYSITNLTEPAHSRMKKWYDWPADVTAEKFRILLSQKPFMSLYIPDDPSSPTPMKEFGNNLFRAVRNTGVLAYRMVKRWDDIILKEGDKINEWELVFYPAKNLNRADILRNRGIKVISARISDLAPRDESIRKQLKLSWLEEKKKEENIKRADYELEAARIINHARIRAQQSMNYHLTKLLEKQEHPREALALLIFQELEAVAANPKTRSLLPENTLDMMNGINQLLLQSRRNMDDSGNGNYFQPPGE